MLSLYSWALLKPIFELFDQKLIEEMMGDGLNDDGRTSPQVYNWSIIYSTFSNNQKKSAFDWSYIYIVIPLGFKIVKIIYRSSIWVK